MRRRHQDFIIANLSPEERATFLRTKLASIGEEDARLRANSQDLITLPQAGELIQPLLAVIPLQLLAYRMSAARGFDPDYPRNLSKTLTVD